MFFVGASGQLLTLLLTVFLPLVFVVTGHKKIELTHNTLNIEIQLNQISIDTGESCSFDLVDIEMAKNLKLVVNYEVNTRINIPIYPIPLKTCDAFLNSSGR